MNQQRTPEQTSRSYPIQKQLSWWPDREFNNDLLLSPQGPTLQHVTVTAALHPETFETVVEIQCQVRNLRNRDLQNLQIHAIIVDEFGSVMTRLDKRLWTRLVNLGAHEVRKVCLTWHQETPDQSYHLLLRLENPDAELLDAVAGDFVLGQPAGCARKKPRI